MTMTSDETLELAHREAWRYKKSSDPHHSDTYTFNISTLLEFARKLVAAEREACAAHTWLFEEWWEKNWEGMGEIADDAGKFIAKAAWDAATGYERDACANVCESLFDMNGGSCAEAVRLRSNVEFSGGAPLHGAASAGTKG